MFICCLYCRVSLHVKAELCSLMSVNQTSLATLMEKRRQWETTITWRWGAYPVFPFSWKILRFKVIFVIFSLIRVICCVSREGWVVWLKRICYGCQFLPYLYLIFYFKKVIFWDIYRLNITVRFFFIIIIILMVLKSLMLTKATIIWTKVQ